MLKIAQVSSFMFQYTGNLFTILAAEQTEHFLIYCGQITTKTPNYKSRAAMPKWAKLKPVWLQVRSDYVKRGVFNSLCAFCVVELSEEIVIIINCS